MKIITRRVFLFLSVAALVAAPLCAADATPKYLGLSAPDPMVLLAPPPVDGTAEAAADLETVVRAYNARTPDELARAQDEVKHTIFCFTPAIGPWFVPGKFPKTEALLKEIEAETKVIVTSGKKHWQRLRPYQVDPARLPDSIEHEAPTDYSYPSGHSTRGTVWAFVLAEIFPEHREAILAKGRDSGWLRVLGGVHYPTDIYAGRVLGQALARAFLASPAFQQDLAAVRVELAGVH
jgi:acid phosphatase (class A)